MSPPSHSPHASETDQKSASEQPQRTSLEKEPLSSENLERRSQTRGLLILALAAIAFAILRAGVRSAFPAHWWQSW